MKTHLRSAALFGLLSAGILMLAAGCAASSKRAVRTMVGGPAKPAKTPSRTGPQFSSSAATSASADMTAAAPAAQVSTQLPTAKPAPATPASPRLAAATSRALDLYGEFDASSSVAGAPLDGSTNLEQVSFATEGACVDPDIDRTGTMLVFASTMHRRTSDIYLKSVAGRIVTQITSDPADDVMPAFSPDGSRIAFASNRSGNWDIFITDVQGGPPTQITSETDHELHPTWSPDGRTIAYCRFGAQSARWEIWTMDVANPGARRFIEYGVFPTWCPDIARNKIAFQRAKQRGSRDYSIWTIDIHNGHASQPTEIASASNAALINPSWSPDGGRIAFVAVVDPHADASRPRQSDVWVVNVDGSNRMNLTNGRFANFQPTWAKDGAVYFVSDRSGVDNVWAVRAMRDGAVEKPQPTGVANADNDSSTGPQR